MMNIVSFIFFQKIFSLFDIQFHSPPVINFSVQCEVLFFFHMGIQLSQRYFQKKKKPTHHFPIPIQCNFCQNLYMLVYFQSLCYFMVYTSVLTPVLYDVNNCSLMMILDCINSSIFFCFFKIVSANTGLLYFQISFRISLAIYIHTLMLTHTQSQTYKVLTFLLAY